MQENVRAVPGRKHASQEDPHPVLLAVGIRIAVLDSTEKGLAAGSKTDLRGLVFFLLGGVSAGVVALFAVDLDIDGG